MLNKDEIQVCNEIHSDFIAFILQTQDRAKQIQDEELLDLVDEFIEALDADLHDYVDGGFLRKVECFEEDQNRFKANIDGGECDPPRRL